MKVIGTTDSGYIVTATLQELALCGGYSSPIGMTAIKRDYSGYLTLPVGTCIDPITATAHLEKLRNHSRILLKAAVTTRALATLMEEKLPDIVVPPDAPEPDAGP